MNEVKTVEQETKPCPDCDGSGWVGVWDGPSPLDGHMEPCEVCNLWEPRGE